MLRVAHAVLYLALAALAAAIARRDRSHAPIAIALGSMAILDLLRPALIGFYAAGVRPYQGVARLVFHVDEAIVLSWPVIMLACALHYFLGGKAWRWAGLAWLGPMSLCLFYPYFSGPRLESLYSVVGIAVLFATWASIAAGILFRSRLRPSLAHLVVILYAATDVGTWLLLFVQGRVRDWPLVLMANVLLLLACVVAHVWWLLAARPVKSSSQLAMR